LYGKGDGREQLDKDLYDDLGHCRGGWDLRIDVEAPQEGFERLEKIDKCIGARANIFDRLKGFSNVTIIRSSKPW
jgi:hypothetical protein